MGAPAGAPQRAEQLLQRQQVDEAVVLGDESGALERMAWTADGQILTVGSDSGTVYNFLACLPVLSAACGSRCAAAQSAPFRPACECV